MSILMKAKYFGLQYHYLIFILLKDVEMVIILPDHMKPY